MRFVPALGVSSLLHPGLALLLLALASCVSPTLPPDDPPAPDVVLGEGTATLSGMVPESPAFVIVLNRDSGLLFGQRTLTGAYAFEIALEPCDALSLWYEAGTFQSSSVDFVAAERAGLSELCSGESGSTADAPRDAGLP